MIKIAICEDKLEDLSFLQDCLQKLLIENQISYTLTSFTSGKDMLQALEEDRFALSFIDIYLDEVDGIVLAKKIRAQNREAAIVFTTSSEAHMAMGYQIGVLHYLLKPFVLKDVEEALNRALRMVAVSERYSEVTVKRQKEQLLHREIRFVESQNRSCVFFTESSEKQVYCRLDALEEQLDDPRFLRCHRSFLVNMDKIVGIEKREFILDDQTRIPMNREKAKQLQADYANYKIRQVREGD